MANELHWEYRDHDFTSIHETIHKYFPTNSVDQYDEESVKSYQGVKEIEEVINDNFFSRKNYRIRWVKFKKFLKQELKKPIRESMVAFYPCYSGFIILKKEKVSNLNYTKELHFFISLLGPYYTIFGVDKSEILLERLIPASKLIGQEAEELADQHFAANLAVTVSPYLEYEKPFQALQRAILDYFPTLKFIPYKISTKKIEGISLLYPDSEIEVKDSVFSALFRPDNFFNSKTRGDTYFGFDEWLKIKKLDKERIKEIKDSLLEKSLKNESELTVHKVWRFKSASRIPSSRLGSMTFGMDLIVLDLTDINHATVIAKEDEEPIVSKYSVADHEIRIDYFQDKIFFKIGELRTSKLKVILNVDLNLKEEKSLKGDIIEILFELYK